MKVFEELKNKLSELELDETKVNELVDFAKKEVPKEFIPKDKYNEKVEELTSVNEKLEQTNKQIEELKDSTDNVEEYKTKLEEIKNEYEEFKSEADNRVNNIKKQSILKDRLLSEGADQENIDLLMKDFDLSDMKLEQDKIIGLDDYLQPVKEKRKRLFIQKDVETDKPPKGDDQKNDDELSAEELIKKRLEERGYKSR